MLRKKTLQHIPVSHILSPGCHQPAPLTDQSQILCMNCSHQQECYERRDPESGENGKKKRKNYRTVVILGCEERNDVRDKTAKKTYAQTKLDCNPRPRTL